MKAQLLLCSGHLAAARSVNFVLCWSSDIYATSLVIESMFCPQSSPEMYCCKICWVACPPTDLLDKPIASFCRRGEAESAEARTLRFECISLSLVLPTGTGCAHGNAGPFTLLSATRSPIASFPMI